MKTTYLSFILILTLGISQSFGQLKRPERVQLSTSYETYFYELDEKENWQEVDSLKEGSLIIENSFPKGNWYVDPSGETFTYVVFWTRVINETDRPIELAIDFPSESFRLFPEPDSYIKVFLPTSKMTPDQEPFEDYGLTNLRITFDLGFILPSRLRKTIQPKEEYMFNVGALAYQGKGTARTGLIQKEGELFYKMSFLPFVESYLLPCGEIMLK
ncbi:MAG: hypothetical protein AAGC85_01075 [Bacteroidota bacterium]